VVGCGEQAGSNLGDDAVNPIVRAVTSGDAASARPRGEDLGGPGVRAPGAAAAAVLPVAALDGQGAGGVTAERAPRPAAAPLAGPQRGGGVPERRSRAVGVAARKAGVTEGAGGVAGGASRLPLHHGGTFRWLEGVHTLRRASAVVGSASGAGACGAATADPPCAWQGAFGVGVGVLGVDQAGLCGLREGMAGDQATRGHIAGEAMPSRRASSARTESERVMGTGLLVRGSGLAGLAVPRGCRASGCGDGCTELGGGTAGVSAGGAGVLAAGGDCHPLARTSRGPAAWAVAARLQPSPSASSSAEAGGSRAEGPLSCAALGAPTAVSAAAAAPVRCAAAGGGSCTLGVRVLAPTAARGRPSRDLEPCLAARSAAIAWG